MISFRHRPPVAPSFSTSLVIWALRDWQHVGNCKRHKTDGWMDGWTSIIHSPNWDVPWNGWVATLVRHWTIISPEVYKEETSWRDKLVETGCSNEDGSSGWQMSCVSYDVCSVRRNGTDIRWRHQTLLSEETSFHKNQSDIRSICIKRSVRQQLTIGPVKCHQCSRIKCI